MGTLRPEWRASLHTDSRAEDNGDGVLSEPLLHASRPLLDFIEDPLVTKAIRTLFGEPCVSCWRSTEAGRFENL